MDFNGVMNEVKAKYRRLLRAKPFILETFPKDLPKSGIYCMEEKGRPLYVGRSNCIRKRLRRHTLPKHNSASFAFLITRVKTGNTKAAYSKKGSRNELLKDPKFKNIFHHSIGRICKMKVRIIQEDDQVKQALLEIYASYMLKTPFNDFGTH